MHKKLWPVVAIVCLPLMLACGRPSSSNVENVFGPDNREDTPDEGVNKAVGRLDSGCTGTLIGKRLVLTAAHCVFDAKTATVKPDVNYFRPNLRAGESATPTWIDYVWLGTKQPEEERGSDWAILRLADDLSDYGSIGIHISDFAAQLPYTVSLMGYSTDRDSGNTPAIHRGCYVHKIVDGKLFHDCDGTAGVSGGPLVESINGNVYIVGITVSEYRQGASGSVRRDQYSEDYTNVAVPASTFAETATQIIKNVDGGTTVPQFYGVYETINPNLPPNGDHAPADATPDTDPPATDREPDAPPAQDPDVSYAIVDADLLLRREGLVLQTMADIESSARYVCDLGYAVGRIQVLDAGEDLIDVIDDFNGAMSAFVNGRERDDYAASIRDAYVQLLMKIGAVNDLDVTQLPRRAVDDLESVRADLKDFIERMNSLILN